MTHAVVLGAGMAGLLTARVLSEFYDQVTVVERDRLPDNPVQRRGVPQGRHLHSFLSRGCQLLDQFFPGLNAELVEAGANVVDDGDLSRVYTRLGAYQMNRSEKFADPAALVFYLASRPFVEFHVRRRVAALDNVKLFDGHDVTEPTVIARHRITGVLLVNRDTGERSTLNADLVVDAMGRAARTPAFLDKLGYGRPEELRSAATWAYSSQLLRIPDGAITEKMLLIESGKGLPRAGLLAYEDDTWILTLGRRAADGDPPTNLAGMLALAEQCLPRSIVTGLRSAQPLNNVAIFRNTGGLWRRYDRMQDFPAGLLVTGDALCNLNPIYGQGMTMAALEALALQEYLRDGTAEPLQFFRAVAKDIGPTWAMNQSRDRVASSAEERRSLRARLATSAMNNALKAAQDDIVLTERFMRVAHLVDPPTRLQDPALMARVLFGGLRRRRITSSTRRSWCTTVRLARRRVARAVAR
jgi:2-polyprenyl-6-methoxyphenol hydroxylase-like FAD-dependent oxidoreductase